SNLKPIWVVQPGNEKYFALSERDSALLVGQPAPPEGTQRDRHGTLARVAMDAVASVRCKSHRRNARSVRRSRVVLTPRPWRQADRTIDRRRWQARPLTEESTK